MNKFFVLVLMFLFILGSSAPLYAEKSATQSYRLAIGDKFARGSKNVLFGWTELPKQVVDITKETHNPIWGLVAGVWQGTLKAMARTASGVSDVITAPINPTGAPFVGTEINVE